MSDQFNILPDGVFWCQNWGEWAVPFESGCAECPNCVRAIAITSGVMKNE
jgi:hypothetical protein